MTAAEAKIKLTKEWIDGYYEWLQDYKDMPEQEYAQKYGWLKRKDLPERKDNWESVKVYLEYIFNGRYIQYWERAGYDRRSIWSLYEEGFLSYKLYSNWNARASGRTEWFYISQRTARQIYKENRRA